MNPNLTSHPTLVLPLQGEPCTLNSCRNLVIQNHSQGTGGAGMEEQQSWEWLGLAGGISEGLGLFPSLGSPGKGTVERAS